MGSLALWPSLPRAFRLSGSLALLAGSLTLLALWLSVSTFSILVQHLHLHRGGGYYYGHVIDIGVGLF